MHNPEVETLLITSRCSAGCLPCPFSQRTVPQRYLPAVDVVQRIRNSTAQLVVVTGGEPLEHPRFSEILERVREGNAEASESQFRIATGGHIPLTEEWIVSLMQTPAFAGISLGTDVLSALCPERDTHREVWKRNVALLNALEANYSLTITCHEYNVATVNSFDQEGNDSAAFCLGLLADAFHLGAKPEFLYVRVCSIQADEEKIRASLFRILGPIKIVFDYVHS